MLWGTMMNKLTRRALLASTPGVLGGAVTFGASPSARAAEPYEAATARIWRAGPLQGLSGAALSQELVRYATLAPSSHNTQCWKFALDGQSVIILPDLSRRCPVVDPDDHHLCVSLGCAAENLVQAGLAPGLASEVHFGRTRGVASPVRERHRPGQPAAGPGDPVRTRAHPAALAAPPGAGCAGVSAAAGGP